MESLWLGSILQSALSPFLSRCLGHGKKWSNTVRLRKEAADCVTMNIMYLHLWNINFVIYYYERPDRGKCEAEPIRKCCCLFDVNKEKTLRSGQAGKGRVGGFRDLFHGSSDF